MGVNVGETELTTMANAQNCAIGNAPFSYLGIRVGISYKSIAE